MSSGDEDYNDHAENSSNAMPDSKKRRVQRACDTCRRKKIRCDGSQMPGNRCSNCIAYSLDCTYVEAAKKRGPPKGYVESLENRLEKMEKLLQKVCPDADFSRELGGGRIDRETWQKGHMGAPGAIMNAGSSAYVNASTSMEDLAPSDDEGILTLRLSESFKSMNLSHHRHTRFFGKSSGIMLIQKAMDLKKEATGTQENDIGDNFVRPPEEEESYPWELAARFIDEPEYTFPDEELGMKLVNLYFAHVNILTPFLHRPSFERKVMQGVHLSHSSFGAVYLLVCAVASRYTDDPRVLLNNIDSGISEHSAGWKFFQQVQMVRRTLLGPPCLEDLQTYCLSVLFLQGTSAPQACWTIVGIGIRLAQDVGAHRRRSYNEQLSVEGELWKRAFWTLVLLDRQMSSSLGRPCAIQDEDFDLDYPINCDDEYWDHPDPEQRFKQPPDKPSSLSFFISFIKLYNILSFAHRTIYSINKSKILLGFVGQQWEQHIVADLDSSLNKWIDEVPDHLRWDPSRDTDSAFMMQSSALYANYYHVQIFIHRPFIPSPRKPSPLSFPSLAICTNAARSCSHVIDVYRKRAIIAAPFLQMPAFTSGIVLLLNIWGGKRSGLATDPQKEMSDVHKCMSLLKGCESRWHTAGRLWDILYELASVGDLPLPQPSPPGGTKRERDSDTVAPASLPTPVPKDNARTIAGSRRISREVHSQSQQQSRHIPPQPQPQPRQHSPLMHPPSQSYNLPVYSNDLGRLPVHGQLNFPVAGPSAGSSSTSTSVGTMSPSVWFSSLSSGTQSPQMTAGTEHTFDHGHGHGQRDAYSTIDDLFLDQISSPYANFHNPGVGGTGTGGAHSLHPQQHHHHPYSTHGNGLQAFMDASVPGMTTAAAVAAANGMLDVDSDTMAMWSTAPTGFGINDWGTYLSSVSGIVHPADGPSGSHAHLHQHGQ